MEKMGFDLIWIKWIMNCVSSLTYSIIINESTYGFIKPERRIRQGDPLSPFFFILCAEALVYVLNQAELRGGISRVQADPLGTSVHHLFFADASLLLCKASASESHEIKRCLALYGEASGQAINSQKSSIIFASDIQDVDKAVVKIILGIDKEGGEGKYLGLPECFSGSKRQLLNFIRKNIQVRLHGWFAKFLSQGGKEFLLKSVAMTHRFTLCRALNFQKKPAKKITSAMIEFWWSSGKNKRKISWIAWKKLCQQKSE